MAYFELKSTFNATLFLLSGFATIPIQAAKIRKYNYKTDYQAAHNICVQHWKSFAETDSICSGIFDTLLLTFTDLETKHASQLGLKSKVILNEPKIVGIVLYAYPLPAAKLLTKKNIPHDDSYAELCYIAVDKSVKGDYKTALFNSCKAELLKSPGVKTVLARAVRTDRPHIAWLEKQGFIPLDHVTAISPFEESYRLEAEASKLDPFKLELKPRSAIKWDQWRGHLLEDAEELEQSAEQNTLSDLAQSKIAHMLAESTAYLTEFTYEQRVYIARRYLRDFSEREKTLKTIAYTLGLTKVTPEVKGALERLFDFVDDNVPALIALINSPSYLQKLLDEVSKIH